MAKRSDTTSCYLSLMLLCQAKAHVRELQSHIVSATLQQLAKDAAELAEDAEVSESGSERDEAGGCGMFAVSAWQLA